MSAIVAVMLSVVGARMATLVALELQLWWQARLDDGRERNLRMLVAQAPSHADIEIDQCRADGSRTSLRITSHERECHDLDRTR